MLKKEYIATAILVALSFEAGGRGFRYFAELFGLPQNEDYFLLFLAVLLGAFAGVGFWIVVHWAVRERINPYQRASTDILLKRIQCLEQGRVWVGETWCGEAEKITHPL